MEIFHASSAFQIVAEKVAQERGQSFLPHPDLEYFSSKSPIDGMTVHHGTVVAFEGSVRAGPKNISEGTGGQGLYVAIKGDQEYAKSHAESTYKSIQESRPVVLNGQLNPRRNFRVLKIQINNNSPNIRAGQFPATWHQDPALLDYVLKNFDILEVSMHTPQSKRGGFLVVTERAGSDAIIWQ